MITRPQLAEAKKILAVGGSLSRAAQAIGADRGELDLALWNGIRKCARSRPAKPTRRPLPKVKPAAEMRPWTGAEQRKLRMYWLDGVQARVIARALRRTEGAIYGRAAIMRLPSRRIGSGANATPLGGRAPQDEPQFTTRDAEGETSLRLGTRDMRSA